MRPAIKMMIAALILILLIGLIVWAGNLHAESVRNETFARDLDALAAACVPVMLEQNLEHKKKLAASLADAGRFSEVTLTDGSGHVLASTNRTLERQSIEELQKPPVKAIIKRDQGRVTGFRAIAVGGDNAFAGIKIEYVP